MKKIFFPKRIPVLLLMTLTFISILLLAGCGSQSPSTSRTGGTQPAPVFVETADYNIDEPINMPKVLFVYTDPNAEHPNG